MSSRSIAAPPRSIRISASPRSIARCGCSKRRTSWRATISATAGRATRRCRATHHDHLIDLQTGRVIEFRNEEIEKLQRDVAEQAWLRAGRTSPRTLRRAAVDDEARDRLTRMHETLLAHRHCRVARVIAGISPIPYMSSTGGGTRRGRQGRIVDVVAAAAGAARRDRRRDRRRAGAALPRLLRGDGRAADARDGARLRRDFDLRRHCDHLLVLDHSRGTAPRWSAPIA